MHCTRFQLLIFINFISTINDKDTDEYDNKMIILMSRETKTERIIIIASHYWIIDFYYI